MAMVFEHIEKLKRDYTDKYVLVDDSRPELARFKGTPGRVKTVNMSGKALVQFDTHANIGWYDIDVDYLKVIDRPVPQEPEKKAAPPKKPAAKPAAEPAEAGKKLSPLEMARLQGASGAKAKEPQKEKQAKDSAAMSVAEKIALLRGEKGGAAPAETKPQPEPPAAAPEQSADEANEQAAVETPKATPTEAVDRASMSVADILAWCRAHDAA
jgi:hypothetical protein